ncbi:hypothetical protein HN446_00975 [bacterium]|jgi:hypothetical protein|nr:hypothetical protein [bacterium]
MNFKKTILAACILASTALQSYDDTSFIYKNMESFPTPEWLKAETGNELFKEGLKYFSELQNLENPENFPQEERSSVRAKNLHVISGAFATAIKLMYHPVVIKMIGVAFEGIEELAGLETLSDKACINVFKKIIREIILTIIKTEKGFDEKTAINIKVFIINLARTIGIPYPLCLKTFKIEEQEMSASTIISKTIDEVFEEFIPTSVEEFQVDQECPIEEPEETTNDSTEIPIEEEK